MHSPDSHHYVIFSARYAPEVGGVESFSKNIAHELVSGGDKVTVVSLNVSGTVSYEVQPDGVNVLRLPCYSLMEGRLPLAKKNADYRRLMRRYLPRDIDRVLVNTRFYGHSLDGLRFAKVRGARAVVLDHGSAYLTLGNSFADTAIKCYEHIMTAFDKTYAPTFSGISLMSAHWLQTFGIFTDLVIPNAIDASSFRREASNRDFRKELNIPNEAVLVVSVGRLSPEKGSRELIETARALGTNVAVAIAGEGTLRREIEPILPANAFLLGNLTHPDLSALLRDADLFCLPSRSEGFCTSLLEAGAWGLVPVVTHIGGSDEIMGNPVRFGRLLPDMSATSIIEALRMAIDAREIGHLDAFRLHVEEQCSWAATANSLREAFEA